MKKLKGTIVVAVTPFTSQDEIDEKGFRQNLDWYISEGIHGICCTGSSGEFLSLTEDEFKRLVDITLEQVEGRVPVLAGTCGPTTKETIKKTKYAENAGVDVALIVHPYYHLPTEDELYDHYRRVAEAVNVPIMIYNNVGCTLVDASPELLVRLARDFENIQYVKETSAQVQRVQEIISLGGDDVTVFCGDDRMPYESLVLGAKGWIAASSNIIPNRCARLFDFMDQGDFEKARELWFEILPLTSSVENWGRLVQTLKAGLDLQGRCGGPSLRGPKKDISSEQKAELRRLLSDLGEL
jgi:4-hydroxy-tetrahydrodipicolinate synthase